MAVERVCCPHCGRKEVVKVRNDREWQGLVSLSDGAGM